jgi:hypothetical protein
LFAGSRNFSAAAASLGQKVHPTQKEKKKMKRLLIALILVTTILLSACGSFAASTVAPSYDRQAIGGGAPVEMPAATMAPYAPAAEAAKSADSFNSVGGAVPPVQQDRLVIQNADYSLVVKDPKAKMDQMSALARTMGGFVVSANLYQTYSPNGNQVPEGTIVIRVPADRLEEALKQIKADVVTVQNETRSGQDVTQEYVDLKSRLKNLEAAEAQLTKIMEQATKTEDVLNVFNQLVSTREQIEVIKGQMQYYEQSANYSAISARLIAEETIKPIQVGGWKPQGVVRDAIQSLINFLQDFVNFLIWSVLYYLPKLLLIGLVVVLPIWLVYILVRAIVRRSKKNKTPAPPEPPAAAQ